MARRSQTADPEELVQALSDLVRELSDRLSGGTVGEKVAHLVLIQHVLRDLGASIAAPLSPGRTGSGRARLIAYLRAQTGKIVHTDELMIVAGIGDYPRRIRELRAEEGWPIISGLAVRDIRDDAARHGSLTSETPNSMAPEEYLLIEDVQDADAVRRWALAGRLRDKTRPLPDVLLQYLRASVGRRVTAEELRYVADNKADWTHALRSLAEQGWPIRGHTLGSADLPFGIYVLDSEHRKGGAA